MGQASAASGIARPALVLLTTNYDWSARVAEYDLGHTLRIQRALNGNRQKALPSYDILGDPADYAQRGGSQLESRLAEYSRTIGQDSLYPCVELRPDKIVVHAQLGRDWRLPLPVSDGDLAYQLLSRAIHLEGDEFGEARTKTGVTGIAHIGLLVTFVSNDAASHDKGAHNHHLARLVGRLGRNFDVRYLDIMRRQFESYALPSTGTHG